MTSRELLPVKRMSYLAQSLWSTVLADKHRQRSFFAHILSHERYVPLFNERRFTSDVSQCESQCTRRPARIRPSIR